jgi:predicted O-methyltransferase YrrM
VDTHEYPNPSPANTEHQSSTQEDTHETLTVIEGDALKVLPELKGQFDFVYIDAVKSDYLKYFQALEPKLSPGAVIVADNVIRSAKAMPDFLEAIAKSPNYISNTIRSDETKRDGMMVIYKVK